MTAYLIVDLQKPGDSTGKVRYLVARKSADSSPEPFTPCDTDRPPVALVGLRMLEPPERRGWISRAPDAQARRQLPPELRLP